MRVVAILNQKGGVGKTTTAVNLGAALALREEQVLLIDMDSQGNLTDHLGIETSEDQPTAYDVLTGEARLAAAVVPTSTPHLSVVPGHEDLAAVEQELSGQAGREVRLRDALATLPPKAYDWVLIDCPPSLGLLSLNALSAAREVFIALQTEYFALRGLGQLDRIVELVRTQINPALRITGIVPTLVDPVTNLAREVLDEVKRVYGHRVFATRVRKNVRLAEAPGHRQHIFAYAPTSAGAADYHALADEVLALEEPGAAAPAAGSGSAKAPATPPPPAKARIPVAIPVEEAAANSPLRSPRGEAPGPAKAAAPVMIKSTPPPAPEPKPSVTPRREGGRFVSTKSTPAPAAPAQKAAVPAAKAPAPAPQAPAPAPKAAAAVQRPPVPPTKPPLAGASPANAPLKPPVPKSPPPAAPAPSRPAVPAPALRHQRPWMKPPGGSA